MNKYWRDVAVRATGNLIVGLAGAIGVLLAGGITVLVAHLLWKCRP